MFHYLKVVSFLIHFFHPYWFPFLPTFTSTHFYSLAPSDFYFFLLSILIFFIFPYLWPFFVALYSFFHSFFTCSILFSYLTLFKLSLFIYASLFPSLFMTFFILIFFVSNVLTFCRSDSLYLFLLSCLSTFFFLSLQLTSVLLPSLAHSISSFLYFFLYFSSISFLCSLHVFFLLWSLLLLHFLSFLAHSNLCAVVCFTFCVYLLTFFFVFAILLFLCNLHFHPYSTLSAFLLSTCLPSFCLFCLCFFCLLLP